MNEISVKIWQVFGHQIFVDGLVSSDPHPGNILVDERTGSVGLIDFGGVLEVSVAVRVRYARLVLAVAQDKADDMAQCYAQLGIVTKRMSSELISMVAKLHHGNIPYSMATFARIKELMEAEGGEPNMEGFDPTVRVLVTSIMLLRGSSMCLGTIKMHYPASMWVELAKWTIEKYGLQYPAPDDIELDLGDIQGGHSTGSDFTEGVCRFQSVQGFLDD